MEIPIFLVPTLIKIENGNRDFAYLIYIYMPTLSYPLTLF